MANLRFSFVAASGTVNFNSPNINVAQETLLVDWLWAQYAPVDGVEGSPTFGQTLPRTTANEAKAFRNYADKLWRGTRANIQRWKLDQDRAAIIPPVIPEE